MSDAESDFGNEPQDQERNRTPGKDKLDLTLEALREKMNDMLDIPHIKGDRDFSHMIKLCNELLTVKGHDYTQGAEGDRGRLKNFYVGADRIGVKPIQILSVYLHKHQSAIDTFVQTGQVQSEGIEGRIADSINYLLLMWKMIAYEKREIDRQADEVGSAIEKSIR